MENGEWEKNREEQGNRLRVDRNVSCNTTTTRLRKSQALVSFMQAENMYVPVRFGHFSETQQQQICPGMLLASKMIMITLA
jgi:hypothetical protein